MPSANCQLLIYTDRFPAALWKPQVRSHVLKILVCMKQVPQKDAPLKLNETAAWIREDVSYEVNEPDAYALEAALRQTGISGSAGQRRRSRHPSRRQSFRRPRRLQHREGIRRRHQRREIRSDL